MALFQFELDLHAICGGENQYSLNNLLGTVFP